MDRIMISWPLTPALSPVIVGIAFLLAAAFPIYRLFFAPLSHIPGPKITALTCLWVIYHEFKGDRTLQLDRLHQQYGPVVRVSPGEVSFNCYEALKEIYGVQSKFSKSSFYDMFVYYNERNTFTSLDKAAHSMKKKLVADRYSKSYVSQPSVAQNVEKHAVRFLDQVKKEPVLDVYWWLHYYAIDCITTHLYGALGTRTLQNLEHRKLVYDLSGVKHRTRLYSIFYFSVLMDSLEFCKSLIRRVRGLPAEFHVRGDRLNSYGINSVIGFQRNELEKDSVSTCSKLFQATPNNVSCIAAECMDHMVAGVDTTGDAMCILMWILSMPEYQHVQDKLFEELRSAGHAFDPQTKTAPISVLDKLPYLDAVITEGLRWRAPVPMTLFRVVPSGGKTIAGYYIPSGTVVGCQAYSLHRIPEIFSDPDRFDPERWLTSDPDKLSAMKSVYWPFSSGARMCLGHNFAAVEMKTILSSIYRFYKTRPTAQCTEENMRMDDQLTSGVPYSLSCLLKFEPR